MVMDAIVKSNSFEIEDFTKKAAYNIDLFQEGQEEKKTKQPKASGNDVEMKEERKQHRKRRAE